MSAKDLRRNVVWRADRRVCHDAARLAPGVDVATVADGEVNLVDVDGVAIVAACIGRAFEELLVVGAFVLLVEAGRQAKVGEFDVAFAIKEDVVRFDVTTGIMG